MRVVHAEITETVSGLHYRCWVTEHGEHHSSRDYPEHVYERTVFGVDLATPTAALVERLGFLVQRTAGRFKLR